MRFNRLLAPGALLILTACGSGSGGSDGAGQPTIQREPDVVITEANAKTIAATVVDSIDDVFDAGESALEFGGAVGARIETDGEAAPALAMAMVEHSKEAALSASSAGAVGAVISEVQECSGGGSVTVSIDTGSLSEQEFTNQINAGSLPAGTSVTSEFTNCVEPEQPALNGSVTIVIRELVLEGEAGLDEFTMDFSATFDDFRSGNQRVHGDISLRLVSSAGMTDSAISGDSLEVAAAGELLALLDYDVTALEDNVVLVESFNFTLDVSALGTLGVETVEAWRTNAFAEHPISGVLRIIGAARSSITILALDEVSVQLDVDSDGDGTTDRSFITTWAELEA